MVSAPSIVVRLAFAIGIGILSTSAIAAQKYASVCDRNFEKVERVVAASGARNSTGSANERWLIDVNLYVMKLLEKCIGTSSEAAEQHAQAAQEYRRLSGLCDGAHGPQDCLPWGSINPDLNRQWYGIWKAEVDKALSDPNYSADLGPAAGIAVASQPPTPPPPVKPATVPDDKAGRAIVRNEVANSPARNSEPAGLHIPPGCGKDAPPGLSCGGVEGGNDFKKQADQNRERQQEFRKRMALKNAENRRKQAEIDAKLVGDSRRRQEQIAAYRKDLNDKVAADKKAIREYVDSQVARSDAVTYHLDNVDGCAGVVFHNNTNLYLQVTFSYSGREDAVPLGPHENTFRMRLMECGANKIEWVRWRATDANFPTYYPTY